MKTYKQLPIPEDSAWSRNTLYGKLHWRVRYFLEGVVEDPRGISRK